MNRGYGSSVTKEPGDCLTRARQDREPLSFNHGSGTGGYGDSNVSGPPGWLSLLEDRDLHAWRQYVGRSRWVGQPRVFWSRPRLVSALTWRIFFVRVGCVFLPVADDLMSKVLLWREMLGAAVLGPWPILFPPWLDPSNRPGEARDFDQQWWFPGCHPGVVPLVVR
jgi:hypothetical protein